MAKEKVLITIERTPCYGSCPAYTARIFADGIVVYWGEHFVKVTGESRFQISEKRVSDLIEAFEKIDFFSLNNLYPTDVTCGPSTILTFVYGGRRKRVVNEHGYDVPPSLGTLADRVDTLARLNRLIGKREGF